MNVTAKSQVAVIVPLFGYSNEIPDNPLLKDHVLSIVMNRIYSNVHQLFFIFVAVPETLENNPSDPASVSNVLLARDRAGNVKNIPVGREATYPQYVAAGMEYALHETKAQFVMVVNPWVLIQEGAVDAIVDRANRADEAKIISGYDMREKVEPEEFDTYRNSNLKEQWDISLDFLAMPRFAAEMVKWENGYLTHFFMEQDLAQSMKGLGFAVISYPQAGMFPFSFPWKQHELKEQYNVDQETFTKKWGFSIGLPNA